MTTSPAGCARPLGGGHYPYLIQRQERKVFREGTHELAALTKQCLDRRIGSLGHLRRVVSAWADERNERMVEVKWRFTTADARIKLRSLYPPIQV